ncbi:MAG: hypothetical protein HPY83_06430 [Anaerolineae bacterium]|nr:hypothetical protein [Anaerolineae bacterium]
MRRAGIDVRAGAVCLALLLAAACGGRGPAPLAAPSATATATPPKAVPTATAGPLRSQVAATSTAPLGAVPTATASPTAASTTSMPETATPTVPIPTATALAAYASPPPELERLALGMKVFEGEFPASLGREGDIFAFGYLANAARVRAAFHNIPVQNRMFMTPTLEGLEELLDRLPVEVAYLGYDLETWEATSAAEQEDPVAAVARAREIAHSRGLKLAIGPSRPFNEKYGAQLAPLVDIYMPQAKAYQARLSPEEYAATMRDLFLTLRRANPAVTLFLDVSPSPKGQEQDIEAMLRCVQAVSDLIDGVWITYTPPETDRVREFVALLGR